MAKSRGLSGGDKVKSAISAMRNRFSARDEVVVGFLEDAAYPDGTPVTLVATANEYGDPSAGRPPRHFMRDAAAAGRIEWPEKFQAVMAATENDTSKALPMMGEVIKGDIQDAITYFDDPPLADSTIARKGFSNPLIDTAHMLRSVDYRIQKKRWWQK